MTSALLDTGAHRTLLPLDIADDLGIRKQLRSQGRQSKGAGGRRLKTYVVGQPILAELYSTAGGAARFWGPEFELMPDFCKSVDPPLLGREDFFQHFAVLFECGLAVARIRLPQSGLP